MTAARATCPLIMIIELDCASVECTVHLLPPLLTCKKEKDRVIFRIERRAISFRRPRAPPCFPHGHAREIEKHAVEPRACHKASKDVVSLSHAHVKAQSPCWVCSLSCSFSHARMLSHTPMFSHALMLSRAKKTSHSGRCEVAGCEKHSKRSQCGNSRFCKAHMKERGLTPCVTQKGCTHEGCTRFAKASTEGLWLYW